MLSCHISCPISSAREEEKTLLSLGAQLCKSARVLHVHLRACIQLWETTVAKYTSGLGASFGRHLTPLGRMACM